MNPPLPFLFYLFFLGISSEIDKVIDYYLSVERNGWAKCEAQEIGNNKLSNREKRKEEVRS